MYGFQFNTSTYKFKGSSILHGHPIHAWNAVSNVSASMGLFYILTDV